MPCWSNPKMFFLTVEYHPQELKWEPNRKWPLIHSTHPVHVLHYVGSWSLWNMSRCQDIKTWNLKPDLRSCMRYKLEILQIQNSNKLLDAADVVQWIKPLVYVASLMFCTGMFQSQLVMKLITIPTINKLCLQSNFIFWTLTVLNFFFVLLCFLNWYNFVKS